MQQKLWYECQGQNVQCKADLYTEQNRIKLKTTLTSSYCKMPKISVQMLQHVSNFKFTCSRGVYPAKQEALCHSVSHQLQHYLQQNAWSLTNNPNRKHQTKCQIWDEEMETACSLKNKHNTKVFTSYNNAYNNRPQIFPERSVCLQQQLYITRKKQPGLGLELP